MWVWLILSIYPPSGTALIALVGFNIKIASHLRATAMNSRRRRSSPALLCDSSWPSRDGSMSPSPPAALPWHRPWGGWPEPMSKEAWVGKRISEYIEIFRTIAKFRRVSMPFCMNPSFLGCSLAVFMIRRLDLSKGMTYGLPFGKLI